MDRDGNQRVISERPRQYGEVSISPDGTRAVLTIQDPQRSGRIDLSIYQFDGDVLNPLRLEGSSYGAVWTADSRRVVYRHGDVGGVNELRSVQVDSRALPTTIKDPTAWSRGISYPTSLSTDGRTLLISNDELGASDVLAFDVEGGLDPKAIGTPHDLVVTSSRERNAVFSPDGHFVAYESDESGSDEVYVVPYPGPGRPLQVSRQGGALPRWSSHGRELLYVSGSNLMRVEVETTSGLQVSTPRVLLAIPPLASYGGCPYDVSPDGTRFLLLKAGVRSQQVDLRVVVNWIDELERTGRAAQD
jgi:Tol biopolymer transport system component